MMVFKNAKLNSGEDWPNRWESEDGVYCIVRYEYWHPGGGTCGPAHKCKPYFRAYSRRDGRTLGGKPNGKLSSFEVAAGVCMDHRDGKR